MAGSGLQFWQFAWGQQEVSAEMIVRVYAVSGAFQTLFAVIASGLMIAAVFGWRSVPGSLPPGEKL